MAKRRNVSGRVLRNAVPKPRDVAEFVAPRTVNEGLSIANIFGDAAEMTPFAGAVPYAERELGLRDYSDEDILLSAILGFPILGKFKNLKEALGNRGWNTAKYKLKKGERKLYADPNARRTTYTGGNMEGGLSTRSRVNATSDVRTAVDIPAGPYRETNTGSDIVNRGHQARNNNIVPVTYRSQGAFNGARGWQGDMYPPGRSLRKDDMYGPFQWEDKYSSKLNNIIDENENKWEYLINKTRPTANGTGVISKQDIADIAIAQGRPDIAERVMNDTKPRMTTNPGYPNYDKRFKSYQSNQKGELTDNAKWKDVGNRQVEKELREEFASLPEDPDIRFRFADYYGVPDLYQSWMDDPLLWAKYKNDVQTNRYFREASNRKYRRNAGWENPNK